MWSSLKRRYGTGILSTASRAREAAVMAIIVGLSRMWKLPPRRP
jgi:hypothetical protein